MLSLFSQKWYSFVPHPWLNNLRLLSFWWFSAVDSALLFEWKCWDTYKKANNFLLRQLRHSIFSLSFSPIWTVWTPSKWSGAIMRVQWKLPKITFCWVSEKLKFNFWGLAGPKWVKNVCNCCLEVNYKSIFKQQGGLSLIWWILSFSVLYSGARSYFDELIWNWVTELSAEIRKILHPVSKRGRSQLTFEILFHFFGQSSP